MDEERMKETSLPLNVTPFRVRTGDAWAAFLAGEHELRALMDQKDRAAVSERLGEICAELLAPAFTNPAFELGHNGEKYELILTPEGDRTQLFPLIYFQKQVPKELLETWNIKVGRTPSKHFRLQMHGQDISLEDVQVWAKKTGDSGLGLELYCEKLAPLMKENEGQVYNIIYILLDQALGELAAMQYVDDLAVRNTPAGRESLNLAGLADFVATQVDPEGWSQANDPETAGERYTAYRGTPSEEEDWPLRADVYAGVTCCVPLLNGYFQGDDYYMDRLHQDGIIPGFFYYPLEGIDRADILTRREQLEAAILARAGERVVTFTGGATGTQLGYLDFIAWDLKGLLDAAAEIFAETTLNWAAFHTFQASAQGILLKQSR